MLPLLITSFAPQLQQRLKKKSKKKKTANVSNISTDIENSVLDDSKVVREPVVEVDGTDGRVTGAGGTGKDQPHGKALGTGTVLQASSAENGGELDILNFSVSDGGLEAMEPVEV